MVNMRSKILRTARFAVFCLISLKSISFVDDSIVDIFA